MSPAVVKQYGQFVISVKNKDKLDREKQSQLNFKVYSRHTIIQLNGPTDRQDLSRYMKICWLIILFARKLGYAIPAAVPAPFRWVGNIRNLKNWKYSENIILPSISNKTNYSSYRLEKNAALVSHLLNQNKIWIGNTIFSLSYSSSWYIATHLIKGKCHIIICNNVWIFIFRVK